MTPITSEPAGNQQNQQHSYESVHVSDDNYKSLDMENREPSVYQILHLNKTSLEYYNMRSNNKYYNTCNNKCTKDHGIKGIMIN